MSYRQRIIGWIASLGLLSGLLAAAGSFAVPAGASPPSCTPGSASVTCTFPAGQTDWSVPAGVTRVSILAYGAQGGPGTDGTPGGLGGEAQATILVKGGTETLQVNVGGQPGSGNPAPGGANGGGESGVAFGPGARSGGGGGGASDVRTGAFGLGDRIVVAGGGGGGGTSFSEDCLGGSGGGSHGGHASRLGDCSGASGGTQHAGGSGGHDGTAGTGGTGDDGLPNLGDSGGGGGGGYFGGGGGFFGPAFSGGGGGGSGFVTPFATSSEMVNGVRRGDGLVTITYQQPPTTTTAQDVVAPFSTKVQIVTLTAAVSAGGLPVDQGTVTFTVLHGGNPLGNPVTSAPITNGTASARYFVPADTPVGRYTIDARYGGSPSFPASSDDTHALLIFPAPR